MPLTIQGKDTMNRTFTLLQARVLQDGSQEGWLVPDVVSYNRLIIHIRVLSAGSGGTLVVQTSPRNNDDDSEWVDTSAATNLSTAATTVVELTNFGRFIRWSAQSPSGNPIADITVTAKVD